MKLILILVLFCFSQLKAVASDTLRIVDKVFTGTGIVDQYPDLLQNEKGGVIIFRNKVFHERIINDSNRIYSLDEGFLYFYDVHYFVVFDTFSIIGDTCTVIVHSTSRYKLEQVKYFKLSVLFIRREGIWQMAESTISSENCCKWKLESW